MSLASAATECAKSSGAVSKSCGACPGLSRWRDEVISTRAWRGTGFGAWKSGGSVQERTAEYLEKREAERWDYPAWRDKVLREHYAELEAAGFFERHPDWRPAEKPTEITH